MSSRSKARAERRAMARAGVAVMSRFVIAAGAFAALAKQAPGEDGAAPEHDALDLVLYNVDAALRSLMKDGGDVMRHTVVTIGAHPDYPGDVTVEAKCAHKIEPPPTTDHVATV